MLRLGVVADIHWCSEPGRTEYWHNRLDFLGAPERLGAALALFHANAVHAVALLGDLAHDGDQASLDAVLATCAEHWTGPTFVVAGNHDRVTELPDVAGELDPGIDVRKLAVEADPERGALRAACGEAREADPLRPLVLLSHYPLLAQDALFAAHGFAYAGNLHGADAVLARLDGRAAPAIVLCGHVHGRESRACRGVLQLTLGALIEPPYECAIVEVDASPAGFDVRRVSHRLGPCIGSAEPVFATDDETWTFVGGRWRGTHAQTRAGVTA
jgi:predicted phosphodiesterase